MRDVCTKSQIKKFNKGETVTTYIEKRLNGELVSKEILSNDTYSPMQTKIRVGPAAPVAPAPVAPGVVGP